MGTEPSTPAHGCHQSLGTGVPRVHFSAASSGLHGHRLHIWGVPDHAAGPVAPIWCWHLLEGELQMQRCSGHCWYTQHQLQGLITAQQLLQLSAFSRGLMEMVAFRLLWSLCVPQFPLCTCASVAPIAHDGSGATVVMLSSSSLLVTVMHSSSIFFLFSDEYGLGREAFRCDTHHLQS